MLKQPHQKRPQIQQSMKVFIPRAQSLVFHGTGQKSSLSCMGVLIFNRILLSFNKVHLIMKLPRYLLVLHAPGSAGADGELLSGRRLHQYMIRKDLNSLQVTGLQAVSVHSDSNR